MIKLTPDDLVRIGILCGQIEYIKHEETDIPLHKIEYLEDRFLPGCGNNAFDNFYELYKDYYCYPKYSELSITEIDFLGRIECGLYIPNKGEELNEKELINNSKYNFCTFKIGALLQFMKDNGVEIKFISDEKNEKYYDIYNKFKTYIELTRNLVHKKIIPNTHIVVSTT